MKRALDVFFSSALLVVLAVPLVLIGMTVRLKLGTPIIFSQDRPGKDGRVFRLRKFRTMTDARDSSGRLLPDRQRLTRFGRLLRATSADELPELWNVLKGDMSLVGPRPLLVEYLDRYTSEQARRHEVRPGITGLAQVSGRNEIPWEERLQIDVWYVDNRTLWLDARIVLLTLWKVLRCEGVTESGHETMSEFKGRGDR